MKKQDVLDVVSQYDGKSLRLTEFTDEDGIEVYFNGWYYTIFYYNQDEEIIKVDVITRQETYYGETEEHFKWILDYTKFNAEFILYNKNNLK